MRVHTAARCCQFTQPRVHHPHKLGTQTRIFGEIDASSSASDQIVSPEERDKRKKLAEDKLKRVKESEDGLGAYERSAQSRYEEQARRVQVRLSEEIRSVLEAKAKSAGCALVLDVAGLGANGSPIILYSNNENDLTQVILDELNAAAPPEALKTPEKPPAKKAEKKK